MCARHRTGSADRRFAISHVLPTAGCDCQILAATRERKKIEMERGEPKSYDVVGRLRLKRSEARSPTCAGPSGERESVAEAAVG